MGKNYMIGLVGGMGPQATAGLFNRLVDAFPGERDWERPHILVDCFSEMPSRVRAVLYNERKDEIKYNLGKSIDNMILYGANRVFVGCHTAHIFLKEVLEEREDYQGIVLNILDLCRKYCSENHISTVRLLASEGTVQTGIYEQYLSSEGIEISNPSDKELVTIRKFIEAVKQKKMDADVLHQFRDMIQGSSDPVILGCSELPVIYSRAFQCDAHCVVDVIDPLQCAIDYLKNDFEEWNSYYH